MKRNYLDRNFEPNGRDNAASIRETFTDRPSEHVTDFGWDWPSTMVYVGQCESVMYVSDKWHPGDYTSYKHVSEGPQRILAVPGFLKPYRSSFDVELEGEKVRVPKLPKQFAELADCLGVQASIEDSFGDTEYFQIDLTGMMLGGLKHRGKAYLCVYDSDGCKLLIDGAKLDIQRDGITG